MGLKEARAALDRVRLNPDPDQALEEALAVEAERDLGDERAYADHSGMALRASRSNPRVRRWIRLRAASNLEHSGRRGAARGGQSVGGVGGHLLNGTLSTRNARVALGKDERRRRENGLNRKADSALRASHYHRYHGEALSALSQEHGVARGTLAHALATEARELHGEHPPAPEYPAPGANHNYHQRLGHEALTSLRSRVRSLSSD